MTTNKHSEHLSALIDGETNRFETRRVLDSLLGDAEQRGRWARYHLIGEALRQERPLFADGDFSRRVMARIETEAQREKATESESAGGRRRWVRPLAGLAMAASVAGAMVFGLQSMLGPGELGSHGLQQAPLEADANAQSMGVSDPGHHVANQLESYMRMNRYMLSHVEQSDAQGVMPYARMVGYVPGNS